MTMNGSRLRPGDGTLPAFQSLLDQHAADVLRLLVRLVGAVEADDCFQETWLSALRAYPRLRSATNLRGWVLTIARNKANDARRSAGRAPLPIPADLAAAAPSAAGGGSDGVWEQVAALPAKQRAAVRLRFAEDRAYPEIAGRMQTSEASARRNVHEGIKKLRRSRT